MPRLNRYRPYPDAVEVVALLALGAAWWAWERAIAAVRWGDVPRLDD
jgi:hypothetical protein